jgi:KRAB domain-containing zinc finger protein
MSTNELCLEEQSCTVPVPSDNQRPPSRGQLVQMKHELANLSCSSAAVQQRPYRCSSCDKLFKLKHQLANHLLVHSGRKPYSCEHCSKQFRQPAHLAKHVRELHQTDRRNASHVCPVCGKGFASRAKLGYHQQGTHAAAKETKKLGCPVCGKEFSRSKLRPHVARVHESEEALPHACSYCQKRFASPYYLERHKRQRHQDRLIINSKLERKLNPM